MMTKVRVPEAVLEGIMTVRGEGRVNMFDRHGVLYELNRLGRFEAVVWVHEHPREYAGGILRGFATTEEQGR